MKPENVTFVLEQPYSSYWKRVFKILTSYIKWLIIGILILIGIDGAKNLLLAVSIIFSICFIYSCFFAYKVLVSVTHDISENRIKITFVKFDKSKDILVGEIQKLQIRKRKRYRYRYPIECLIFSKNDMQIFTQEAINGWTNKKFQEIEAYFKLFKNKE